MHFINITRILINHYVSLLQSSEIDDMQELFELLEIKSDVWKSTKERQQAEERNRSCDRLKSKTLKTDINSNESSKHDAPSGSSHSESELVTPGAGYSKDKDENMSIKKENMSTSSNDEREDEEQDGEHRNKESGRLVARRRSSSNPVNLSLARNSENTGSEQEHDQDSQDVDVETVAAKVNKHHFVPSTFIYSTANDQILILTFLFIPEHREKKINIVESG